MRKVGHPCPAHLPMAPASVSPPSPNHQYTARLTFSFLFCPHVHFPSPCRFHYATLALEDAKLVAALITIPPPPPFSIYLPALLAASLAFIILQAVLVAGLYAWRSLQQYKGDTVDPRLDASLTAPTLQRRKPLAIASGVVTALQYGVVLWFVFMLAISFLWYGGGMVAVKATTDAVATMSVVDETFPRLIQNAMGVDPREQVRQKGVSRCERQGG